MGDLLRQWASTVGAIFAARLREPKLLALGGYFVRGVCPLSR